MIKSILPKLGKTQQEITQIYVQIIGLLGDAFPGLENKTFKDSIVSSISALIEAIISAPLSLTIPSFTFNFLNFDLDIPNLGPIQATGSQPGVVQLYTQIITSFFQGVADLILSAGDWLLKITQGLEELLTYLVQSLFEIISQSITSAYPTISQSSGLISSIAEFSRNLIQMTIVTILGYLLGPGLITLISARLVGLV